MIRNISHGKFKIFRICIITVVFIAVQNVLPSFAKPVFNFETNKDGWRIMEGQENTVKKLFVDSTTSTYGNNSLTADITFPGEASIYTYITRTDTSIYENLEIDIHLHQNAPEDTQAVIFLQDGEWLWYETRPFSLSPGEWQSISVNLAPESMSLRAVGHSQPWGPYSRANINTIGIKVQSNSEYAGQFNIDNIRFNRVMFPQHHINNTTVEKGDKIELSFNLPTNYSNPFDPDEIDVTGIFTSPQGEVIRIPGFFYQNYQRRLVNDGNDRRKEALDPIGHPEWRIRFTPIEAGYYSYKIRVNDHTGERQSPEKIVKVQKADPPGFVQLDSEGEMGFILDSGEYFFPIGFNYRSPYDTRYDENILGEQRTEPTDACAASNVMLDDGSVGFEENIAEMAEYGMNFIETWLAPWWIALEWSPQRIGFKGAGYYNLRNAWRFDRIMDAAAEHGVYVQLVIINHGQLSTFVDEEWQDHPYNVDNGGFLDSPEEVFTDPRARRLTRNKFRYIVARWGYSPYILSWDILNEINLVGDSNRFWRSEEIVEWADEMASYLKEIDPWQHLVTAHFTGNFDSDIFRVEELDYTANNAYYNVNNTDLVTRMTRAYNFHTRFEKPFLFAEFGGTSGGGSIINLKRDLQVGLWAGYTMPLAASPLFWWHQLIRDQDWYYMYQSLADFENIVGEKRRFMTRFNSWQISMPEINDTGDEDNEPETLKPKGLMMHCDKNAAYIGWFYNPQYVKNLDNIELESIRDASLTIKDMAQGTYRLVLWDTKKGKAILDEKNHIESQIDIELPDFEEDIAIFLSLEEQAE